MQRGAVQPSASERVRCAFCGYELSDARVRDSAGVAYCSERCRDAAEAGEEPFAGEFDFKRFSPGVPALESLLPNGIPSNSFVLLTGESGIRHRGLQTELVWRTLRRDEPAIVITFVDPPIAIVEHFLTFDWNVLPYLESGDLQIIDCYTMRLRKKHRTPDHQAPWNEFLGGFLDGSVSVIQEPGNLESVENSLHDHLEAADMTGTGIVVIDSLNEVEIQGREAETEQFIKEVRGDVCSRKFVPIFASVTGTADEQPTKEYDYLFDGIVQMQRNESRIEGVRLKQLSIQKMDGALYRPHWVTYEITGPSGFRIFTPETDLLSVYGSPTLSGRAEPATHSRRGPPHHQQPR
jgi:KaiC/GvpD/RAD55 family RecA-like ATPase